MATSVEHVEAKTCNCKQCLKFMEVYPEDDKNKFDFSSSTFEFKFPVIVNPKSDERFDFFSIAKILETPPKDADEKKENALKVVRFLTYLDTGKTELPLKAYIMIAEYLFEHDMQTVITDQILAADFLQKMLQLFVLSWYELTVQGNKTAEWAAREFRRILAFLLGFPVIASQVLRVVFPKENWPTVSPITILEGICKDWLICLDTASFLANFTRIENVCGHLEKESKCLRFIEDKFSICCVHIQKYDDMGELFMLVFMNLTASEKFLRFLIESNSGFFMNIVLADLIAHHDSCTAPRSVVWTFLRNLSLMERGREMINRNLELYLGHILYPIAGPEKLDCDENVSLPLEVADLHESKKRVKDVKIRGCILDILYSLCRYKIDRISLRNFGVYEILKHYHLTEQDSYLLDKIEDLVNILIRKEGSEIEVDDLMEGLSLGPSTSNILRSSENFLTPRPPSIQETERIELKQILASLSKTYSGRNAPFSSKVFLEDDDNLQPFVNTCTLEARSSSKAPFDYHKFESFFKLRASLFQVRRQQKTGDNYKLQTVNDCVTLPEEFLKQKFSELYGPVNFDEPLMKKRLIAMKSSIMDISNMQPDEVRIKLLEHDVECVNLQSSEDQLLAIINRMFPVEVQQTYGKLNPKDSEGEWFHFPRLPLPKIRNEHFPEHGEDHEVAVEGCRRVKTRDSKPSPLTNLHLYDPRFEYCFDKPYRIFIENPEDPIPRILSLRIHEFLNNFPFGITSDMFWLKFTKKYGSAPRYEYFLFPSLTEVLRRHETDLYVLESSYTLIFPAHLERVAHPDIILKRLWHLIKSVIGDYGCIATDEIFKQIKDEFGIDFDPMDWAFTSVNAFINFIIEKFSYKNRLTVLRIDYEDADGNKAFRDYLTMNCEALNNEIKNLHGLKSDIMRGIEDKGIYLGRVPKGYLHQSSTINSFANNLVLGSVELTELKCIHDPERLILFFRSADSNLWRFHNFLQRPDVASEFVLQHPPDRRLLLPGMYVLANAKWGSFGPFWFRVRILWIDQDSNKYYVYGIDFGFLLHVELKNMRYMPRPKIGEELAYAVPAKLAGVKNPGRVASVGWNMSVVNRVFNLYLRDGPFLKVTLAERRFDRVLGCAKWAISCDSVDKDLNTYYTRFETLFLEQYKMEWKRWKDGQRKDGKKKEKDKSSNKLSSPIVSSTTE